MSQQSHCLPRGSMEKGQTQGMLWGSGLRTLSRGLWPSPRLPASSRTDRRCGWQRSWWEREAVRSAFLTGLADLVALTKESESWCPADESVLRRSVSYRAAWLTGCGAAWIGRLQSSLQVDASRTCRAGPFLCHFHVTVTCVPNCNIKIISFYYSSVTPRTRQHWHSDDLCTQRKPPFLYFTLGVSFVSLLKSGNVSDAFAA